MNNETLNVDGRLHIRLFDENGKLKDERKVKNTVTTYGKSGIANCLKATPDVVKPGWMAIGTGTPAATLLGSELDRNALTSKTNTVPSAVLTMVGDWAAGDGTGAITEAGIFDVVTANTVNMWCSASFSVINKAAGDTLSITWTLTIS